MMVGTMAGLLEQLSPSDSLRYRGSFPLWGFLVNTRGRNLTGTVPPCLHCGVGLLGDVTSFDRQSYNNLSNVSGRLMFLVILDHILLYV